MSETLQQIASHLSCQQTTYHTVAAYLTNYTRGTTFTLLRRDFLKNLYIPALVSYKVLIPIGFMLTLSLLLKGFYFFMIVLVSYYPFW